MARVMKHLSLLLLKVLLIALITFGLYQFGTYAFDFGRQIYSEEGMTAAPGKDVAVVVSEGEMHMYLWCRNGFPDIMDRFNLGIMC